MENACKHPCIEKYKKKCAFKYKLNQILCSKISKSFQYVKQKYFEFGDKPQKLLARQLRKIASERAIYKIKSDTGEFLTSSRDINRRLQSLFALAIEPLAEAIRTHTGIKGFKTRIN